MKRRSGSLPSPASVLSFLAWLDPKEAIALPFLVPLAVIAALYGPVTVVGSAQGALMGFGVVGLVWLVGIVLTFVGPARRWLRISRIRAETVLFSRDMIAFGLCFAVYGSLQWAVPLVQPRLFDPELVQMDRLLFGGRDPALVFDGFVSPTMTLLFGGLYFVHFIFLFATPVILFIQGRPKERADVSLAILLTMYGGFIGYYLTPAYGPLYGLKEHFTTELPANVFLEIVHTQAVALGTFPSLHAAISAVVVIFAWRDNRRLFWLLLPLAIGIWVSTLYLRYHYVIDLLAGWSLALSCCWLAPRWNLAREQGLRSPDLRHARVRLARRVRLLLPGRRTWTPLAGRSGV